MITNSSIIKSATIIITSYNYGQFVGETIASALSQTFPNVEVIVVDDGSTDDSLNVIRSFGERIILLAQENMGAPAAECAGFDRATGDLILILDSDDVLYPTAIEETAALFDADTSKVQFFLEAVDVATSPLGLTFPLEMPREEDIEKLLFQFGCYQSPPTSGNAYSRRFLQQILPYPEMVGTGTDLYASTLAPLYGKVKVCEKILGGYRIHGGNMHATRPGAVPTLGVIRTAVVSVEGTQRALEAHCAKLNKPIQHGLHWRRSYYCKLRLISLKADQATHPFPKDRPFKLAWRGLVSTFFMHRDPTLSSQSARVVLFLLFLLLPLLSARLVIWRFLFNGRARLQRLFRSPLGRAES
jgi:glycosyltransferase involved in cell wall biosynthesis